ncbi:MAG TPA: hypothetical protein VG500_14860 [Gemmatimonadales bacterium]|jgi:hypothetical protein|nr:hypothetical protein [Gemmatimonadales bacterium]
MREATGPMSHGTPVGAAVAGRYELVGVNGSLLPVSLEADQPGPGGCSVVAGELRLQGDGRYILELTARYDTPAGAGGIRTIATGGTWRFLPSALDRTSGEVRLISGPTQSSAAVAGVSLVHRLREPERHPGAQAHWVYIRR